MLRNSDLLCNNHKEHRCNRSFVHIAKIKGHVPTNLNMTKKNIMYNGLMFSNEICKKNGETLLLRDDLLAKIRQTSFFRFSPPTH